MNYIGLVTAAIIFVIFLGSLVYFHRFGKAHKTEIEHLPDDYFDYTDVEYLEEDNETYKP